MKITKFARNHTILTSVKMHELENDLFGKLENKIFEK